MWLSHMSSMASLNDSTATLAFPGSLAGCIAHGLGIVPDTLLPKLIFGGLRKSPDRNAGLILLTFTI